MALRYTLDGSDALERRIGEDLARVRDRALEAVGESSLTALVLGGGYGRGEGAVWREDGEERPYNDYDLFAVVPFTSRRRRTDVHRRLNEVGHALSPGAGVDVEFGPPLPRSRLASLPYELMMMELKAGHRVFYGPADILSAMPNYDPSVVPLHEGARLLLNRGVGLLLARRRLAEGEPAPDDENGQFIIRNVHKAMAALGDCVLFIHERYSPVYHERAAQLESLDLQAVPEGEHVARKYREAIEFKLRPTHRPPEGVTLGTWLNEAIRLYRRIHLWFERRRLGLPEMTWEAYGRVSTRLDGAGLEQPARNAVRNLRAHGAHALWAHGLFQHPRDRLMAELPVLLYGEPAGLEEDFLRRWRRFS